MSRSPFIYIDTATGGPHNRNNALRLDQFKPNGAPDVYSTYRLFTEDLPAYMSRNLNSKGRPSVRGYNGPCVTPHLPFDIDVEGDLDTARHELHRLLLLLRDRWEVPLEALAIYFSGYKGFHVEVPEALFGGFGVLKAQESAARLKRLSKLMLEEADGLTVDPAIYDATRLWRAPNTKHGKSGLYKIRITAAEALHLTAQQIKELARRPRHVETPAADDWDAVPALVTVWDATAQPYEDRSRTATADNSDPVTHNRNNYLTSVGGRIRAAGLGEAPIFAALMEHNLERCQPPLAEAEVRQIAASIASYPAGTLPPAPAPGEEVRSLKEKLIDTQAQLYERDQTYKGLLAALRNENLTPGERIAYVMLMLELEHGDDTPDKHHPDPRLDGYLKVNVGVLADSGGMSDDALSPKIKALEERHGLVQRKREFERDPEQQDRFGRAKIVGSHLYVKPVGPLATATLAARFAIIGALDPDPVVKEDGTIKSWGGARCKSCGGPKERKTVEYCPKCEVVEVRPITPPDDPEDLNPQDADLDGPPPPLDMVGIYKPHLAVLDDPAEPQGIRCKLGITGHVCPHPGRCSDAGRCAP